eukprot:3734320-Prymnesium_polylepis.1
MRPRTPSCAAAAAAMRARTVIVHRRRRCAWAVWDLDSLVHRARERHGHRAAADYPRRVVARRVHHLLDGRVQLLLRGRRLPAAVGHVHAGAGHAPLRVACAQAAGDAGGTLWVTRCGPHTGRHTRGVTRGASHVVGHTLWVTCSQGLLPSTINKLTTAYYVGVPLICAALEAC